MGSVRLGAQSADMSICSPGRPNRARWALAIVLVWAAGGCDSMARLKARLHTAPDATGTSDPVEPGLSGLDVVVTPASGMTVLVDGEAVGHTSPACHRSLTPGAHTVYVRAMGYYSLALPVHLVANEVLRLPVALRPRAPVPFTGAVAEVGPKAQAPMPERPRAAPVASAAAPAPPITATLLPESSAIALHMVAQPLAPIVVDNDATDGRSVRLRRARGTLAIGNLVLSYSVNPGRIVDFLVPSDGCQWYRDGAQIKPGSDLRLGRGLLRLKRVAPGGQEQAVVLRRLG